MGDKKGKALALELMDDLLNEDIAEIEVDATTNIIEPLDVPDEVHHADPHSTDIHRTQLLDTDDSEPAHSFTRGTEEDATVRIPPPAAPNLTVARESSNKGVAEDRVRASVGRFAPFRSSGSGGASSTEAALAQSESLRIAQSRMLEFEQEIERLRLENEQLAAAGETLRRRTDELGATNQKRERDFQNLHSTVAQEKEILSASKENLQREIAAARQKNEELELRISTNIQKIRVRERELENRLELVKMESAALIRSKDEMILELKRNIDQLNMELNNYRSKNQELNRQSNDKQEQLRRTVKALRLALSMLEGEEEAPRAAAAAAPPLRKAK